MINNLNTNQMIDYSNYTDSDLLLLTNTSINKGAIPFKAVQEVQKRGLKLYTTKTLNTSNFDSNGKFITK